MNTLTMKLGKITYFFSILSLIGLLFSSCDKMQDVQGNAGEASLKISTVMFEEDNEDVDPNSSDEELGYKSNVRNLGLVAFSHGRNIEVTLEKDDTETIAQRKLFASKGKSSSSSNQKAVIDRNQLRPNVKYLLLAYKTDGTLAGERIYKYGNENTIEPMYLDAGRKYTFIAVSINHEDNLPEILNKQSLTNVKVNNCSEDLMVFKRELTLSVGDNFLNVVLKHRYSAFITKLSIDPNTTGYLTTLSNTRMSNTRASASMNLNTEQITYSSTNTSGNPIQFAQLGNNVRSITSVQKLIINPYTNSATLTFGTITIDGDTKNNLVIKDIPIRPGVKYKLNLNFRTCTQDVTGAAGLDWFHPEVIQDKVKGIKIGNIFYANGETITKTIYAPSADYGFVFDITKLDNTFNMELNGVKLATREVQFQINAMTPQNIMFEDGSIYEGADAEDPTKTIPAIYTMEGTSTRPLVKVVISREGEVKMYGSKKSGGILYPLVLFDGTTFNTFTWNRTSQNTVKITQVIDGLTIMKGYGSGKKKVACPVK